MIAQTLHHVAALYHAGHYDQAVHILRHLLHVERHYPASLDLIHRAMYALNPDWGL
jgi:hypothetical protein